MTALPVGGIRKASRLRPSIASFHGALNGIQLSAFLFVVDGIWLLDDCLCVLKAADGGITVGLAVLIPVGIELIGQGAVTHLVGYPGQIGLQGIFSCLLRLFLTEAALVYIEEYAEKGQQDERYDVPRFFEVYVHG